VAERPPPRAAAAAAAAASDTAGDRTFRLASFALVGAEGAADLFSLMPRGALPDDAPGAAAPTEVSLLGQLLPAAAGAAP